MRSAEFKGLYGPDNRPIAASETVKKPRVKRADRIRYFGYPAEKKLLGLLASLKGDRPARDLMVMEVGLGLGLRVAELTRLSVGDVRNKEEVTVIGKAEPGGLPKERVIPISINLQRSIKTFIKQKLKWQESIHDDAPLFVSQLGGRLARRSLQEMFEKWCIRAGLTKASGKAAYTFHSMRHTFAMRLRERGHDIATVAELLGHSSLNSTRVYFRPSREELIEAVNSL
jgi:site-specific recombinase XerC